MSNRFLCGLIPIVLATALVGPLPAKQDLDIAKTQAALEGQRQEVVKANRALEEVFGPMPAVAATPFLGIALITGTALVLQQPAVAKLRSPMVQSLRQNRLIAQATTYSTWWLFVILAALAVTSALANSGKLQGVVGKVARGGETLVALLAYLIVGFGALQSAPASSSLSQSHMTLPIAVAIPLFTLSTVTLVVAGTIVLAAMMLVRFALDTLIWLSPVPFLDMLFEAVKIAFSVLFLVVYVLNPVVASILAFLFFLPCVIVLPWAWRLWTFAFRIVIKPMVARVLPSLSAGLVEARLAKELDHATLACRAHVLKARGFKKRQVVVLFQADTPASVGSVRRSKLRRPLCHPDERLLIGRSLAWIELRVIGADERVLDRIALPRSLLTHWAQLCHMLHAEDAGEFGSMRYLVAAKAKAGDGVRAVRRLTQSERAEAQSPADGDI